MVIDFKQTITSVCLFHFICMLSQHTENCKTFLDNLSHVFSQMFLILPGFEHLLSYAIEINNIKFANDKK